MADASHGEPNKEKDALEAKLKLEKEERLKEQKEKERTFVLQTADESVIKFRYHPADNKVTLQTRVRDNHYLLLYFMGQSQVAATADEANEQTKTNEINQVLVWQANGD